MQSRSCAFDDVAACPAIPLSPAEALAAFVRTLECTPFPAARGARIVLAVSGGADSLALMLLAAACRVDLMRCGFGLHVVTVDHGLRAESATEARAVAALAQSLGLTHETQRWTDGPASGNLQAAAREARYRLIEAAARRVGAAAVVTAHHLCDQIETHLMAKARGAGDKGLAGMRPCREFANGLFLLRPFLAVSGARLKAAVAAAGLTPAEDPGNADPRFERIRLRQSLARGDIEAVSCRGAIADATERRDVAEARLAEAVDEMAGLERLEFLSDATIRLDAEAFSALPKAIGIALLMRIVPAVAGAAYAPVYPALERLAARLSAGKAVRISLGGAIVERKQSRGGDRLLFMREYGRSGPAPVSLMNLGAEESIVFDRRFRISVVDWRDGWLVPVGRFGIGGRVGRTLPLLIDGRDRPVAVPEPFHKKFGGKLALLQICEDISWRVLADIPLTASFEPTG